VKPFRLPLFQFSAFLELALDVKKPYHATGGEIPRKKPNPSKFFDILEVNFKPSD